MLTNGYYGTLTTMPKFTAKACGESFSQPIATKVISATPGRLRLRVNSAHRQPEKIQRIADALEAHGNVKNVRTNVHHGSITVEHGQEEGNLESVLAALRDLGIIFRDITEGKSEAADQVSAAAFDFNKQIKLASNGRVDMRILFPIGLATLSFRQLLAKGLQLDIIPWYVLAWYSFDSFLKLHAGSQSEPKKE